MYPSEKKHENETSRGAYRGASWGRALQQESELTISSVYRNMYNIDRHIDAQFTTCRRQIPCVALRLCCSKEKHLQIQQGSLVRGCIAGVQLARQLIRRSLATAIGGRWLMQLRRHAAIGGSQWHVAIGWAVGQ